MIDCSHVCSKCTYQWTGSKYNYYCPHCLISTQVKSEDAWAKRWDTSYWYPGSDVYKFWTDDVKCDNCASELAWFKHFLIHNSTIMINNPVIILMIWLINPVRRPAYCPNGCHGKKKNK